MAAETVLIVDNHHEVLNFMQQALGRWCYNVLTAYSGVSALRAIRTNAKIDLLISDETLTRPAELIENMWQYRPGASLILTTADVEPQIASVPYLCKPFTAQALHRRVKDVLECNQQAREALSEAIEDGSEAVQRSYYLQSEVEDDLRRSRQNRWRSALQSGRKKPIVLVVEHNAVARYAFSHHLATHGFIVLDAANEKEAAELWGEYHQRISVILMDTDDLSVMEFVKVFGNDCLGKPILLITSDNTGDARSHYPSSKRPFELPKLLAEIQRLVERCDTPCS